MGIKAKVVEPPQDLSSLTEGERHGQAMGIARPRRGRASADEECGGQPPAADMPQPLDRSRRHWFIQGAIESSYRVIWVLTVG